LALASARLGVPVAADLVAVGEVGLAGELRQVSQTPRRVAEAARLGFGRILLPASAPSTTNGIDIAGAASLIDALRIAGLSRG
ncbi:MAG TPA: DNA repair protein RadA, partial [Acidimicrobiales bacterium]